MNYQIVIDLVKSTRKISLPYFGKVNDYQEKGNYEFDLVTHVDKEIELFLKDELNKLYPDINFVGEEFGGDMSNTKYWLVDPIDGTGPYVRGLPYCTTMLALVDNGKVVFSIIYDFVRDEIYHAIAGGGAFLNGEKIYVSNRDLKNSYLVMESDTRKTENKFIGEYRNNYALLQHMCSGYEFALVASGKIEGRISYNGFGFPYDYAPGALLVKEAGGVVKNFGSENYDFRILNHYAVNTELYNNLIKGDNGLEAKILKNNR